MRGYFEVEPGVRLHYAVDDFTDPWEPAETIVMLHGFAESLEAWRAWVPHLSRRYRLVRVDLRGFGKSTPMAEDYEWPADRLLADIEVLAEHLGLSRFHLLGAKSGGSWALQFALAHPEKVISVLGMTPPVVGAPAMPEWRRMIQAEGVVPWAHATMVARLGSGAGATELKWWAENVQGRTPVSTMLGYLAQVQSLDLRREVLKIRCPTLIVTTTGSGLRTVESVREWQSQMQDSELVVIEGDAWHAAAAYPDRCAEETLAFLTQVAAGARVDRSS